MTRDIEKNPYSPDETRVAKFFYDLGVGGGDDPIGSIIASHQVLAEERRQLKDLLRRIELIVGREWLFTGAHPHRVRLLEDIKEALR